MRKIAILLFIVAIFLIGCQQTVPETPQGTECTPKWICQAWGDCVDNKIMRECSDENNCGIETAKPAIELPCGAEKVVVAEEKGRILENLPNLQENPAVFGRHVVWQEFAADKQDIKVFDLVENSSRLITDDNVSQLNPAIYENMVVWQDTSNGKSDIFAFNLDTNETLQITKDLKDQENPAIYGKRIVYQDNRNGNSDIYLYDMESDKERQLTTEPTAQSDPDIYENIVVWEDYRNGNADIYGMNLRGGKEIQITDNPADQTDPRVYGNYIVWQDWRNGDRTKFLNSDIYLYDLSKKQELQLTTKGNDTEPDIYLHYVVWRSDAEGGGYEIFMKDLEKGKTERLTFSNAWQSRPEIHANIVVWEDSRHGKKNKKIYAQEVKT